MHLGARALAAATLLAAASASPAAPAAACTARVFLTIDTGTMAPALEMAAILRKHAVKATFFVANERTERGDTALDPSWAPFWTALVQDGHAFGSHTWRHWYIRGDEGADKVRYVAWGASQGEALDAAAFCAELRRPGEAFLAMTGRALDPIWRAPGGKLTARAEGFARECGYAHVGWSPAGFSGDELPSEKYPSRALIDGQLRQIRDGDVLLWHLGIRSRRDPLWPHLDTLIAGLKARGFCFDRITDSAAWKR